MLVLTRRVDQWVYIDTPCGRVEILVSEIGADGRGGANGDGGKYVKLGFVAPRDFIINRDNRRESDG